MTRITVAGALAIMIATSAVAQDQYSGRSDTCGPIIGQTQQDLKNVETFCTYVPEGATTGAYAMESLLWVKVSQGIAEYMVGHSLQTEQLVKAWMTLWKEISDSSAVTIYVEWGDVQIAKGDTTLFRGDQVTIRDR